MQVRSVREAGREREPTRSAGAAEVLATASAGRPPPVGAWMLPPVAGARTPAVQASVAPAQGQRSLSSAAINAAARRGTGGAGHELPHMQTIQRSFGPAHDLSRVKAHVGGAATAASAEIGAVAYTYGDHVAFGAAPSLRVAAHEAAHVIQQRQGVQLFGGVGEVGDRYERHADEVAELVVQGRSAAQLLGPQAGGPVTSAVQRAPVVQRLAAGEQPLDDGYGQLTGDPTWLAKAEAYEQRLGVYAYSHAKSTNAVTAGLNKMKAVIDKEYDAAHKTEDQLQSLYREVFTKDDSGSAGQVGATLLLDEIRDLLANGNLRERMTAFYNAAYYNSDPSQPPLRGLKQITADILLLTEESMYELNSWTNWLGSMLVPYDLDLKSWSELVQDRKDKAQDLGLDEGDLGKKIDFLHGSWMRSGIKALTAYTSVGYNFSDDPFALGNLTLERELGGTTEMAISQSGRVKRTNLEREPEKRTAQDYEALGIGLSAREKAYTKSKMGGVDDLAYPTAKLPWLEGHTYYKMSDSNLWVQQIRDGLKMPVVAGVSGTTTRMLTAFKWLNTGADPIDFRLAIMGWMLPAWDHSLYEIMRGSHLAGVRKPEDGDLTDVIYMYSHVPPLTASELRANVAVNKMFPHEEVYMSKMQPDRSQATGYKAVFGDSNYGSDPTISGNAAISEAHAVAIYGYTSGIHVLMNAVLSAMGYDVTETAGPVIVKRKMKDIARGLCRLMYLQERADNGIITPTEQTELDGLDWVEPLDVFEKEGKQTDWETYCTAGGRTSQEVDTYITKTVNPWLDSIADDVYEELKTHITLAVEGLSQLPAVTGVTVYRGDWSAVIGSRYELGKTIELPEFNSFSTDEDTAFQFAKGGNFSNPVLLKLRLTGKGGRDIADFSKYGGEDEVLMMPGSRLRIDRVTWEQRGGKDVKVAEAVEV